MPYKDPDKRLRRAKEWRDEKIKAGYGKALYARRAQRFKNEERLRKAVEDALEVIARGPKAGGAGRVIEWGSKQLPVSEIEERLEGARKALEEGLMESPPVQKPIKYMPKEENG